MTAITEQIKRLADEQRKAWETDGKRLADIASEREFTAEERELSERVDAVFDSYEERIRSLVQKRDIEERALQFFEQKDEALRDIEKGKTIADEIREVLSGENKRGYDVLPTAAEVRAMGKRFEERALSVGTATAGGNTVGKTYLEQLIEPLRQFSGIVAAGAYTLVTGKGDDVIVPRLSSFGAAAAQSEATTLTGTDPAFNQVTFKAFKYGDYRGISTELIEDSLVDIEGLTTRLMGENVAVLLGGKLATGAGTTEPTGAATAATAGKTGATSVSGAFTFDDLIDLQESVLAPYQARAAWVMSNASVAAARKLKNTTTGQYYWEPNGQTGAPSQLLGNPVFRDPFLAAPGLSAKSVLYGDFTRYWVRMVGAVRIERSDQALFGSDQVAFRAVLRADGQLVDTNAIKAFVGGAS